MSLTDDDRAKIRQALAEMDWASVATLPERLAAEADAAGHGADCHCPLCMVAFHEWLAAKDHDQ